MMFHPVYPGRIILIGILPDGILVMPILMVPMTHNQVSCYYQKIRVLIFDRFQDIGQGVLPAWLWKITVYI
jgi:hypothetical protein